MLQVLVEHRMKMKDISWQKLLEFGEIILKFPAAQFALYKEERKQDLNVASFSSCGDEAASQTIEMLFQTLSLAIDIYRLFRSVRLL